MTLYLCFAYDSVYEYNKALEIATEKKQEKTLEKPQLSQE